MTDPGAELAASRSAPGAPASHEGPDTLGNAFDFDYLKHPEVIAALDEWRQGDIVRGLRTFWAIEAGAIDEFSDIDARPESDGGLTLARQPGEGDADSPVDQLGVVVSQTCDVMAIGPGGRHPTVQVVPVVDLAKIHPARARDVRDNKTIDMVLVTGLYPPDRWAADLRISLPVSKAVLVGQTPTRAFANEKDALEFGERAAIKLRRPALHDYLVKDIPASLNTLIRQRRSKGEVWMDRVEQIRLHVTKGDRLAPLGIELRVITLDDPLTPKEQQPLRQWRSEQKKPLTQAIAGCAIEPLRFTQLVKLQVDYYRSSVPLQIDELGRGPFW